MDQNPIVRGAVQTEQKDVPFCVPITMNERVDYNAWTFSEIVKNVVTP